MMDLIYIQLNVWFTVLIDLLEVSFVIFALLGFLRAIQAMVRQHRQAKRYQDR